MKLSQLLTFIFSFLFFWRRSDENVTWAFFALAYNYCGWKIACAQFSLFIVYDALIPEQMIWAPYDYAIHVYRNVLWSFLIVLAWVHPHSPNGSFDARWNSNLTLLHWIVNSTQSYNLELRWNFNSIPNCSFELNCQCNAANSSWNFILNQMISWESVIALYHMKY